MKNLFKALADFQQEVPVIHKGTQGYGYSYADLPAIFQIINPLMSKHGLGFTQITKHVDGVDYLDTVLFHVETGETIESRMKLVNNVQLKGMNDFQVLGSQLTYFRRYALACILGLVTDKDTDASGEQVKKKPALSDERFKKAINSISADYTKEQLMVALEKFELTEDQKHEIEIL